MPLIETIRSFIAIELPEDLKQMLGQIQNSLKASGVRARWVNPEGFHLTLKFLGDIRADKVPEIIRSMQSAASGAAVFTLKAQGTGVFPDSKRAQAGWVGLSGELASLTKLQQEIEANMAALGFPREERAFTPHLTLARVSESTSPEERQQFSKAVTEAVFTGASFKVSAVSLMQSRLGPGGAVYTCLSLVRLGSLL